MSEAATGDREGLSRRRLLAGAAAGAAVLPLEGLGAATLGQSFDLDADVVVVGSGAAGGAAAAKALGLGRSVIMLEKGPVTGGTTAKSGGGYWIFNNRFMRSFNLTDPRDSALKLMARLSYPEYYDPDAPRLGLEERLYSLLEAYYDRGAIMVDDLQRLGALQSVPYTDSAGRPNFPDYCALLPENKAPLGRILRSAKPSGHGGPPNGRGGSGADIVQQFTDFVTKHGGRILTGHRATGLVMNTKREVTGVEVHTSEGQMRRVRARRGVVFASGGFMHNPELAARHLRGPIFGGCGAVTNQGDFLAIAGAAGASMGNLVNAWWAQVPIERALAMRSTAVVFIPPGDAMFLVNKYGRRVVDEKALYSERTQLHFAWDADRFEYPNLVMIMIWDHVVHEKHAGNLPIPDAGTMPPDVLTAPTLDALADVIDARMAKLGDKISNARLDPAFRSNLAETRARFDRFAANRRDEDFHRGELPASGWWDHNGYGGTPYDPAAPNDLMAPLAPKGPYYAILLGAGALDTKGGPNINANAQVLDGAGQPITGLYGAGNCIASPTARSYWAGGSTIGPALTFGHIAGEHAANEPEHAV